MIHEPCIILRPEMVAIHESARIDGFCKIEGGEGVIIGQHVHIASFCHINSGGGSVAIGDHAGIATGARILSGQPDLRYLMICPNEPEAHPLRWITIIGEYALVGAGATIMPGVNVGRGAVAAAGAVVVRDIPDFEIHAGVPAKFIKRREML